MSEQYRRPRRRRRRRRQPIVPILLMVLLIVGAVSMIAMCVRLITAPPAAKPKDPKPSSGSSWNQQIPEETQKPEDPGTEETTEAPPQVVSTATILSTGDLLMHAALINDGKQSDGSYNFDYIFRYLSPYTAQADYAVANLETTLAGTAKPYQGNPLFNCPDAIVDAAKNAGFDMLLTANNHSNDTEQAGFDRTLQIVREKGLATLGTMASGEEPKYTVQDINGISVGMLCYTYEDSVIGNKKPSLNYHTVSAGYDVINCFRKDDPQPFYQEIGGYIDEMKQEGAEAIVLFIHWGEEYHLEPTSQQTDMAQQLCDLGVDVIVGGHPHVVEPVSLLTSRTDPDHRTVCLYSMGNAVSNQRQGKLKSITSGHTEDGVLFSMTFGKYSDGRVALQDVDLIPTWVNAVDGNGATVTDPNAPIAEYIILPLDDSTRENWSNQFSLDGNGAAKAAESYNRTQAIVGSGMTQAKDYLAGQQLPVVDAVIIDKAA